MTLLAGVETGVIAGVAISMLLYLWSASRPHAAVVGRVHNTEHFRNAKVGNGSERAPSFIGIVTNRMRGAIRPEWWRNIASTFVDSDTERADIGTR